MSLLAHKLLCREAVSVLKKNEAPNTCAKPLVSYFNKKHLSSSQRQQSQPDRGEARASAGEGVGRNQGSCAARREGGREEAEGLPLSRPGPQPSAVCAPPLSASCAKTSTETHKPQSQAGDAHGRWSLCVPMIDARAGNCRKCTEIACLTVKTWRFSFYGGRSPCKVCKQRYKIL